MHLQSIYVYILWILMLENMGGDLVYLSSVFSRGEMEGKGGEQYHDTWEVVC